MRPQHKHNTDHLQETHATTPTQRRTGIQTTPRNKTRSISQSTHERQAYAKKNPPTTKRREYPARTTPRPNRAVLLPLPCRAVPHARLTAKRSWWSRVAVILLLGAAYAFGRGLCARDSTRVNGTLISHRGIIIAGCVRWFGFVVGGWVGREVGR
jgi:hypothetical protein